MRIHTWALVICCFAPQLFSQGLGSTPSPITLTTADDVVIFGDAYAADSGKHAPVILLFHQGGSSAIGEFGPYIAPRLRDLGYNVIAVDQRSGGDRFGTLNRTVKQLGGKEYPLCETYPDLEAVLLYAKKSGYSGKMFAIGSSYSAALVFRLAAEYEKDLAGIIAFSPAGGEPMSGCKADTFVPKLRVPAIAFRPATEIGMPTVQKQVAIFKDFGIETYVAENGVHGASTLDPSRVEGGVEKHWAKMLAFLERNK